MTPTLEFYNSLHGLLVEERAAIDQILETSQTPELWDWAVVRLKINRVLEAQLLTDVAHAMARGEA